MESGTGRTHIEPVEKRGRQAARDASLRLALIYAVVATLWILFSDRLLSDLGLSRDTVLAVSSLKGLAFVLVTASVLYMVAGRQLRRLYISEERHQRLLEHSTEGVMFFTVERDAEGQLADLVLGEVNPALAARLGMPRQQLWGMRMSECDCDDRLTEYFDVVATAVRQNRAQRREINIESSGTDELVNAYAIEDDLYALGTMDLTDLHQAQQALRRQEEWIRDAYVDVLDAVTGGKLVLLTEDELDAALGERLLEERPLTSASQLAEARTEVRQVIQTRFPEIAMSMNLPSALGEALNNVLKHAGRGSYAVFASGNRVQICVTDEGPGIDFRTLPKATLVSGFSTASTLGMGFTMMLQLSDRVLISTRQGKTSVVLEFTPSGVQDNAMQAMAPMAGTAV